MITEQEAKNEIDEALKGLPPKSQKRVVKKMIGDQTEKLSDLYIDLSHKKAEIASLEKLRVFFEGMGDWSEIVLQRNDCSRLHHLKDGFKNGRMIDVPDEVDKNELEHVFDVFQNTFVVKHDWRSVLDGVGIQDEEIRLPYDSCAFEFRISGMTIIALARMLDKATFRCFVYSGGFWCAMPEDQEKYKIGIFIWQQIKSICVALDAEVACDDVVRAPYKLNQKREKVGKTPIADFHVVDLAKRHRVSNPSGGESGHKVRLHFRRGHWRHYEDSKTWIKWCLVGNPDLGFISKHYAI